MVMSLCLLSVVEEVMWNWLLVIRWLARRRLRVALQLLWQDLIPLVALGMGLRSALPKRARGAIVAAE